MYKLILSILFFGFLFSCNQENEPKASVDGVILNNTEDSIFLFTIDGEKQAHPVEEDGTLSIPIEFENNQFYFLKIGNHFQQFYFTPRSNNSFSVDLQDFQNTISFEGDHADINSFLTKDADANTFFGTYNKEIYSLEEEEMLQALEKERIRLDSLIPEHLPQEFIELKKKDNLYGLLLTLKQYPDGYNYYMKEDKELSEKSKKRLEEIDFDNEQDYFESEFYRNFLRRTFTSIPSEEFDKKVEFIENKKSQRIKDYLAKDLGFWISPGNENNDKIIQVIESNLSNPESLTEIRAKYDKIKTLNPGSPSPTFDYENHAGGNTTLADLKGKFVYIDVWATWCGPCLAEIPSLKEIEEDFYEDNIEFVSISIDQKKDYDKWRKMVTDRELGGVQLFADNDWQSEFVKKYAIDGIPRFILIDPEGNIENANAPRPSNPELHDLLTSLLR